jgi:hypothetical protein
MQLLFFFLPFLSNQTKHILNRIYNKATGSRKKNNKKIKIKILMQRTLYEIEAHYLISLVPYNEIAFTPKPKTPIPIPIPLSHTN